MQLIWMIVIALVPVGVVAAQLHRPEPVKVKAVARHRR